MNRFPKFYYLLLAVMLVFVGCSSDDDSPVTPTTVDEALELNKAIEGSDGGYMNVSAPAIVKADEVYEAIQLNKNYYIIDVRQASAYADGHVEGAVNVPVGEVVAHVMGIDHASYEKIVVICYTGQSAAWGTALLRLAGVNNAFSMKYGMSSWNPLTDSITSKLGSNYSATFVKTASPAKNEMGDLPVINTGKTNGQDILMDRIATVQGEGFGPASITADVVAGDPGSYYLINYWGDDYTGIGHLPTAIQYVPKQDFKSTTFLKTLPTDKTIVVYCYTGQTSGNVAAILRVMGYNAKSLSHGTQGMAWDIVTAAGKTAYNAAQDRHDYPLVK